MIAVRALAAAGLLAAPLPVLASWEVCNRTSDSLRIAIAYHDGANGWLTSGWWTVNACGGCAKVLNPSDTDGTNVFLHAETKDGVEMVGGDNHFCVSDPAKGAPPWTGRSPRQCRANYVSARFAKQVVDKDSFKTTINSPAGPGRKCID